MLKKEYMILVIGTPDSGPCPIVVHPTGEAVMFYTAQEARNWLDEQADYFARFWKPLVVHVEDVTNV